MVVIVSIGITIVKHVVGDYILIYIIYIIIYYLNKMSCHNNNKKQQQQQQQRSDNVVVGCIMEAPEFMRDNCYIKSGYLMNCHTITTACKCALMLHNETINIWSHLLGTIFTIILVIYTIICIEVDTNDLSKVPLFIMLFSAFLCLTFSTAYHLLCPISININTVLSRFDYAGISLLIAGSCYPPYSYFFHCEPFLRGAYLTFITVFAVSVFVFTLTPNFHSPQHRTLRGPLFLALGISAGIPIIHLMLFGEGVKGFVGKPRFEFWYVGGISYIAGALMYIERVPERFYPGRFDIFGASHQWFHLCVVIGVVSHFIGSLDALWFRMEHWCK